MQRPVVNVGEDAESTGQECGEARDDRGTILAAPSRVTLVRRISLIRLMLCHRSNAIMIVGSLGKACGQPLASV